MFDVSASEVDDKTPLVDGNVEQDCLLVTRKRTLNEKLWKKNVKKTKELRGESYSSAITGKIIPCKKFVPIVCKCIKKCNNLIPELNQKEIFTKFYELDSYNLQTAFLFGLTKVVDKKEHTQKM